MPFEVIKIQDRVKLTAKEVSDIVKSYMENVLSRDVSAVEFHTGRNELNAATVYLRDKDD